MGDHHNPDPPLYSPEGLLTAALFDQPKIWSEIRWVDPDIFEWSNIRTIYVAAVWVLGHHPDIGTDELITRTKNVLIEYEKTDALTLLVTMIGTNTAIGVEAGRYARQLWERWQHTQLQAAALRMQQITHSNLDLAEQVDLIEQTWIEALAESHAEPGWKPIEGLETVDAFMTRDDDTHDWVIPGLLEREERFMVIATEKAGKSVLTRQCCLMLPIGRHPLRKGRQVEPMTTLMIDLENPRPLAARDFRRQVSNMEGLWQEGNERAYVWHRPGGIHLGDKGDRLMLRNVVDRVEPDFLAVCPIYKAYDGLEQSWEQQAYGVQKPFDKIREEYHCAIWMEHHAPWGERGQREIRAIGSSRWARWLDYTVNLIGEGSPPYEFLRWVSQRRDQRKMSPKGLRRGGVGEPSWVPVWDDDREDWGYDLALNEAEM